MSADTNCRAAGKKQQTAARVYLSGGYVCFPDGGPGYDFTLEKMKRDFDHLLRGLRAKKWWTPSIEADLRRILDLS
jgi:hypothetical protein